MLETVFLIAVVAPLALLVIHLSSVTRGVVPEPSVAGRRRPVTARRPTSTLTGAPSAGTPAGIELGHAPDEVRALRQAGLTVDSIVGVPAVERAIDAEIYVLAPRDVPTGSFVTSPGRPAAHARPGGAVVAFPTAPSGSARRLTPH